MFTIEMLPADEGDALWIEYGVNPVRYVLIDCGRKLAYREVVARIAASNLRLELLVLTHVDADHITGAVPLLQDARFGADRVKDVWFNGWYHLNDLPWDHPDRAPGVLDARQGEFFGALLRDRGYSWNGAFRRTPVVVPDQGPLPRIELDGGMVLTLLGPTTEKLRDMRRRWEADLGAAAAEKRIDPGDYERALEILGSDKRSGPDVLAHREPGPIVIPDLLEIPFQPDASEPNGSSISFLAEFDGKAALFVGDAHAPQVEASIRRLLAERREAYLTLDALKLSHHASARNTSVSLLRLLECPRYLVSTNGTRHGHPDPEALARVVDAADEGVELHFNYSTDRTLPWDDPLLRRDYGLRCIYPAAGAGLKVPL
ncbi:MBL fold metallo-hydrolase [Candidatus Binatia bacterium]|nr:MBL fold metallo-hydrolase [Candidatus Binatia bacterium]